MMIYLAYAFVITVLAAIGLLVMSLLESRRNGVILQDCIARLEYQRDVFAEPGCGIDERLDEILSYYDPTDLPSEDDVMATSWWLDALARGDDPDPSVLVRFETACTEIDLELRDLLPPVGDTP